MALPMLSLLDNSGKHQLNTLTTQLRIIRERGSRERPQDLSKDCCWNRGRRS
jgi:hypothetical protein